MPAVVVVLIIVVVFIGLVAIEVGLTVFRRLTQRTQYPRAVMASHAQLIINLTDIPETGWQTSSPGSNETAAWTAFTKPGPNVTDAFNLTLWVEPPYDPSLAEARMNAVITGQPYSSQDGGVKGADASRYWSYNGGSNAGMVVRRYNVVFLINAISNNSFSLTSFDLGTWAGWQLRKIESLATTVIVDGEVKLIAPAAYSVNPGQFAFLSVAGGVSSHHNLDIRHAASRALECEDG